VHRRWSFIFGASSLFPPFLLGLCLGALASGDIRVAGGRVLSGFFTGWTSAFAVACGLFAQGLFAFLAATYLTVDTEADREVQDDFRNRGLAAGLSLAPAAAVTFVLAQRGAPIIFVGLMSWWAPWLLGVTSVCAVGALGPSGRDASAGLGSRPWARWCASFSDGDLPSFRTSWCPM
jgi:cytochrome d ubiquinol oxidase subunit II